jgi:SAM-dependent methyltransferase
MYPNYHPIFAHGKQYASGDRKILDRWNIIREIIANLEVKSLLDLGCAEGSFVQSAANECQCHSYGIDFDRRRIVTASLTSFLNNIENCGFSFGVINENLIRKMPNYDLILMMSVAHHMIYEHGAEYTRNILRLIREKSNKAVIIDMGQPGESVERWKDILPQYETDPVAAIIEFLYSSGYSKIEVLGEGDSFQDHAARRSLFLAIP